MVLVSAFVPVTLIDVLITQATMPLLPLLVALLLPSPGRAKPQPPPDASLPLDVPPPPPGWWSDPQPLAPEPSFGLVNVNQAAPEAADAETDTSNSLPFDYPIADLTPSFTGLNNYDFSNYDSLDAPIPDALVGVSSSVE